MADIRPILEYPTPQPLEKLTLEEGSDFARIVFPVRPIWVYWLSIGGSVAIALLWTVGPLSIVFKLWRIIHVAGPLPPGAVSGLWHAVLTHMALPMWGMALFLWLSAIFEWWKYRRWGRVPRVLLARTEGLTLSYLGWFWMRQKHWPASEITAVELRPTRGNLNWRRTVAELKILRRKGIPLRFRLSSSDSQLPDRIASRVRALLGRSRPNLV